MSALAPDSGGTALVMGDQTVATCANSTNPICYNTAVSGSNIVAGLWFSAILGGLCFLGFVIFRTKFRLYYIRLEMAQVTDKPPPMRTDGLHRIWSWLTPVFQVSDDELLASAGLDALVATRIISFGIWLFLPMTILAAAVLIPINYTDDFYSKEAAAENFVDEYTTVFIRLTMSNLTPGSSVMWAHFVYVFLAVGWACWLITEHYKEYIVLRQGYVVKSTEVRSTATPSSKATPGQLPGQNGKAQEVAAQSLVDKIPANPCKADLRSGSVSPGNGTNRALIHLHRRDASKAAEKSDSGAPANSSRFGREERSKSLQLADRSKHNSPSGPPHGASGSGGRSKSAIDTTALNGGGQAIELTVTSLVDYTNGIAAAAAASRPEAFPQQPPAHQQLPPMHPNGGSHSRQSSAGDPYIPDWTQYDFSKELAPDSAPGVISTKSSGFGPPGSLRRQVSGMGSTALLHAPSNAAVAAALENRHISSAAEALVKIRHHRQASGATPANSGTVTPTTATPRAGWERESLVSGEQRQTSDAGIHMEAVHAALSKLQSAKNIEVGGKSSIPVDSNLLKSHSEQNDPMKRGVVVKQFEDGSLLSANASLYTVLVTDQPVEKLRLGRSIGSQYIGKQITRKITNLMRSDSQHEPDGLTHATSGGPVVDLEGGRLSSTMDEDPDSSLATSEAGIIGSGWMSTWKQLQGWWHHRNRYAEWRRDVRWAMFNRRVRIATEMFTELFGPDFDSIIPIYPCEAVDKLLNKWDAAAAKLELLEAELKDETKEAKQVALQGKIDKLAVKIAALQKEITITRDTTVSDLPSTCFFATFKCQEAAAIAAQANLNPINQRLFNVQAAPSPEDVNWPALNRSWWQRQSRPLYVMPLILLIMLFPIGAFTGAFAQLTIAICGNPIDGSAGPGADSWFCSDDPWASFFRNLLTSVAPSLLLSLYHMCVLPVLVYYTAQAEGQCFSLSELDRRCADLFFYWDVFNVFLGAMLGGSVLAELSTYLNHPEEIWSTLSSAIPASSNFFINYVAYRALVMAWFRLFYPHMAIVTCLLKWARLMSWAKTPRGKAMEMPVRNCRYGRDIGIPVLMNFVMVMAYAVVSPLILPFGLLYFLFLWPVWRYQMLYVYQRSYESGGQMWPLVAHKIVGCLLIMVIFTGCVFIFKAAYTQAVLLLVILPIYLIRFDTYLRMRYDAVVEQVPLMAVHTAGTRVEAVDPLLWTPPPLRPGADGWHLEYCKVWQFWGIPRYTL